MSKPTYKYYIEKSITHGICDEYELTDEEYIKIYKFFITYSMCGRQSKKKRTFTDYGWNSGNYAHNGLKDELKKICDLDKDITFLIEKSDLKVAFKTANLEDGTTDYESERAVITVSSESNPYLNLFYQLRNIFAHAGFVLKFNKQNEKMIVMQDNDKNNVTARIIMKLETLINFIDVIDKNKINYSEEVVADKDETAA